jgi:hypothetical protein
MSKIILKKSSVADKVPLPADLAYGELALNYADSKLFFKKPDNTIGTIGGASGALQNRYSYTATAAQTTFSATYTAPYVDVYLNGLRLSSGVDYVATNGTSVVLTPGAAVNDLVEIVAQVVNIMALVDATKLALTGGTMTGVIGFAAGQTFPGTQTTLVSGTSIKTINGISVLGSGNIQIDGGVVSFNTRTGAVTLSSTDVTTALGFTPVSQSAINSSINAVIDAAPGTLDTLNELAAALGDDPNFATTVTSNIASKLSLSGGSLTGALSVAGTITATQFTGSGAGLTSIPNSATTATNANTVSTIVARDANGDFLAGGINTARGLTDVSGTNAALRVVNPGGAALYTSGLNGAIQIQLPASAVGTMFRMTIKVWAYENAATFDICCGAYVYSGGIANQFAYMTTGGSALYNTRWGWDGSRHSFFIGELDTFWSYAVVSVVDVQAGFQSFAASNLQAGWTVAINSTGFGTVLSGPNIPSLRATNLTGGSAGTIPYQSAVNTTVQLAAGTSGQVLRSNGAAAPSWVNGTISGISLGSNLNTLTLGTSGTGLSGSTTYNGSGAAAFTVTSNATNANTGSTIVARDASGNFSAGTITATLSGTATTATNQSGGTVNATTGAFSGAITLPTGAGTNLIKAGTGDGASFTTYNLKINSWWGIGFGDYQDLTTVKAYIDCRNGNFGTSGQFVGPGTGLTGTASGLSIGGSAGSVTNGVYTIGDQTIGGQKSFTSLLVGRNTVGTNVNNNNDTGSFSVRGDSANAASMSFHRSGAYAINMGLGTDNVFRIGGWSAQSNCLQLDGSGNLTALANVTAYSDERLKKDWAKVATDFVERLSKVKAGTYTRIDIDRRQAGTSAQDWQKLLPEVVMEGEDEDKTLSLAYGNAALVSAVELAKRVVDQEARIQHLETLINTILNKD